MYQNKCTPLHQKETYSYQSAQEKIATLQNQGYQLVGNLPEQGEPWGTLKSAFFLFIKGNQYYQYQGKSLLSDRPSNIGFEAAQVPTAKGLSKIITEDYIYIICPHKALNNEQNSQKVTLLLRKNASLSGHDFLISPYKQYAQADKIVGGEVYYRNGELLLINRKSGSFPTNEEKALASISTIFGPRGRAAYYSSVELKQTQEELRKRSMTTTSPAAIVSECPPSPYYQNKSRSLFQSSEMPPIARRVWEENTAKPTVSVLNPSPSIAPLSAEAPPSSPILLDHNNISQHRFFNTKPSDTTDCLPRCAKPCVIL
ncbi:hypothetical protein [Legionella rowbothamii]|uniref:hypothetical protein n=1 Tax=Legionella rowbothamii TaxID=96229 RepID=UPI0010541C75|nr:hypothetical protein [Legionella rowbothamii]